MKNQPKYEDVDSGSEWARQDIRGEDHTLSSDDRGKQLFYDESAARSLLVTRDDSIGISSAFALRIGPNAGVLTIDAAAGVTLTYWNGSTYVTLSAGANLTAGPGIYTIWKDTLNHFYVDGPALTAA